MTIGYSQKNTETGNSSISHIYPGGPEMLYIYVYTFEITRIYTPHTPGAAGRLDGARQANAGTKAIGPGRGAKLQVRMA